MDALINSDLMQMPGPRFLAFYAIVAAIAVVLFNLLIRLGDRDGRPPPPVPARPEPYEIAYLRGGVEAVVGVAIYALKRMGAVALQPNGQLFALPGRFQPPDPIEAEVLGEIGSGGRVHRLLASSALRRAVAAQCRKRIRRLEGLGLLLAPSYRPRARAFAAALALCLTALAGLKVYAATTHGHKNFQFLIMEAAVALVALWASERVVTRRTANSRGVA
jgi:uncharacterized protein (TIGR04222 family)